MNSGRRRTRRGVDESSGAEISPDSEDDGGGGGHFRGRLVGMRAKELCPPAAASATASATTAVSSDISTTSSSSSGSDFDSDAADKGVPSSKRRLQRSSRKKMSTVTRPPDVKIVTSTSSRKASNDSGIGSSGSSKSSASSTSSSVEPEDMPPPAATSTASSCGTMPPVEETESTSQRLSKNVEQIEALLKKINEENRKTKEVLEAINRSSDPNRSETTTKIMLSKSSVISLHSKLQEERERKEREKRERHSQQPPKDEDMLFQETSIDGKKVPLVMFNCAHMSSPPQVTAGQKFRLSFKTVNADAKLISTVCHAHGFHEVHSSNGDFNLMWTGVHPKPHAFKALLPHQRVNHFPRSYELTRKDRLYQNIERLQHAKGVKNFNFVPKTFMIPAEYSEFAATHHRMRGAWIVKPVASSRGRGIFIVNHPSQVPLDEPMVVAKYIDNPLLVNGHKWDLRLYVAVTSYDPLSVYLYEEGLVRFATVKYDSSGKNLWNPCMHLCNYSINKYHSDYIKCDDPDQEDQGHKWSLSALLRHLKANGIDTVQLMQTVEDVIIKSIISVEFPVNSACKMFVPHKRNCFELYGFDILIDSDLKPWLLEVNLSPSLNCDTPIDMKIKSAMICDLLNLTGVAAVDPVLKRAQFNKKVNELAHSMGVGGNGNGGSKDKDGKDGGNSSKDLPEDPKRLPAPRRSVSVETRRFAAIRLAATSTTYQQELIRMVRNAKEENQRRGGYVRIFPTADTWQNYGALLEYSSQNNLILHEHLYPNATRKAQRLNKKIPATNSQRAANFDFFRKRSQSAGPGSKIFEKAAAATTTTAALSGSSSSNNLEAAAAPATTALASPSSLATSATSVSSNRFATTAAAIAALTPRARPSEDVGEGEDSESPAGAGLGLVPPPKPTACELRVAQYEKPLTKGHCTKKAAAKRDPEKTAKRRSEKRQRSAVLKEKVIKMIEGGHQLSEYQARKAFSVYLHCILQRLSDFDPESASDLAQIDLVLKFLQKAALSLREPYFLKAPSIKLGGKDRAAIVAKELNEFLGHYRRETEVFVAFREEQGMVPRHIFEEFVAFANDADLEDVLTLQTKLYRCAHIFLGKCLPPASGRKNSLLRTAYGISPDRNLRDKQCSMRMNARANPPVAAQFAPAPAPASKCLDISTYEKSKLEELEEEALNTNVVRIGAILKKQSDAQSQGNGSLVSYLRRQQQQQQQHQQQQQQQQQQQNSSKTSSSSNNNSNIAEKSKAKEAGDPTKVVDGGPAKLEVTGSAGALRISSAPN